jgi:hypothetical protein
MTTNLVVPTESQLPLAGEKLTFQAWKEEGKDLVRQIRTSETKHEMDQWEIGEWIIRGVENKEFNKNQAYKAAKEITDFDEEYLQTVVWVVRRFPDTSLRKETTLKWSHFKELAYIEDEKLRDTVLRHFNDGGDYSVREVREHVREELGKLQGQNSGKKQQAPSKYWVSMQLSLKKTYRDRIKDLARAENKPPDELLGRIVMEYFEEHRKDIAVRIEKAKKKKAKR